MQVYSTLIKIAKKQIRQAFIYLGIFAVLIIIMANSKSNGNEEYIATKCNLVIFDYDKTEASKMLVDYLSSIHEIKEIKDDKNEILDMLYLQNIDYVLYIREGYSENGKLENIKRPGSSEGNYVDSQIDTFIGSLKALVTAGYTENEAYEKTIKSLDSEGLVSMYNKKTQKNPTSYFIFLFTPYVMAMMLFNILGPVLVAYNRKDVSDRANISSMKNSSRNLQLILASITIGIIIWGVFALIAIMCGGGDVFKDKIAINFLNMFVYALVVCGVVNIFGNYELKPQTLSMLSNIYGLSTSFLGGIFVTLEIFGEGMYRLAHFMPTFWYVQVLDDSYEGKTDKILMYFGVMFIYIALFWGISFILSRKKKAGRVA